MPGRLSMRKFSRQMSHSRWLPSSLKFGPPGCDSVAALPSGRSGARAATSSSV